MNKEREQEILLVQRLLKGEVDRILTRLESITDPVRYAQAADDAQQEFNRLDKWAQRQARKDT